MIIPNIAIEIEGHDKNGKDTIAKYIEQLGSYRYTLNVRGVLTQLVYNDKFKRGNEYRFVYKPLIILLSTEEEDVEIRCRMTKEPKINSNKDREIYEKYAQHLEELGLAIVWRYNTSNMTPYQVGKDIVSRLEGIDAYDFVLSNEPKYNIVSSMNCYNEDDTKNEDVYYGPLESSK